jgi:hypothetical protein
LNWGRLLNDVLCWAWPVLSVVLSYAGIPFLIWHAIAVHVRRYRIVEVAHAWRT